MQSTKNNQVTSSKITNKKFNLIERTASFSRRVLSLAQFYSKDFLINKTIIVQLLRSATAIGANYIEANDALGIKDFLMRLRISRKEAKETIYWLNLLKGVCLECDNVVEELIDEANQLKNILSAIIIKVENR